MMHRRKPMDHLDTNLLKRIQPLRAVKAHSKVYQTVDTQTLNSGRLSANRLKEADNIEKCTKTVTFNAKENSCQCGCEKENYHNRYTVSSKLSKNLASAGRSVNGFNSTFLRGRRFLQSLPPQEARFSPSSESSVSIGSNASVSDMSYCSLSDVSSSMGVEMDGFSPEYDSELSECQLGIAERLHSESLMHEEILEEYCLDVIEYLLQAEKRYQPKHVYLLKQNEINSLMRTKLVDWLIEVQDEYRLHKETLHLAVSFVDRFLSKMFVTRSKLQLVGTACLFLAAKYEEIYPPDSEEFSYVTADTYTKSEVLMMERMILGAFDYKVAQPTMQQYMTIFHKKCNINEKCQLLSFYFLDLILLKENFLRFLPSVKAAASITLAILLVHENELKVQSQVRLRLKEYRNQIYTCAKEIVELHQSQENIIVASYVREKYSKPEHLKVGSPACLWFKFSSLSMNDLLFAWLD